MVLSFKPQFVDKILDGSKIHTIREDKGNRWQAGKLINFATGVRTPQYKQFHQAICTGVQTFSIEKLSFFEKNDIIFIEINGKKLTQIEKELLAKNDGFDSLEDFCAFFKSGFRGEIIHWTDFKY